VRPASSETRLPPVAGLRPSWCRTGRCRGNRAVRGPGPNSQRAPPAEPLDSSSGHVAAAVGVAGEWRKQQPSATRDVQGVPASGAVALHCVTDPTERTSVR